jgi:hypothetical protein
VVFLLCRHDLNALLKQREKSVIAATILVLRSHGFSTQVRSQNNTINQVLMQQEWRSELFKPSLPLEELDYLGFPMSVAKGRRILDICHETWKRWEVVAMEIPEYKLLQIQMQKQANPYGKSAPITPYQAWVVGKIGDLYQKMPQGIAKEWLVKKYIAGKKEEFTRAAYQEEQERYTTMVLEVNGTRN